MKFVDKLKNLFSPPNKKEKAHYRVGRVQELSEDFCASGTDIIKLQSKNYGTTPKKQTITLPIRDVDIGGWLENNCKELHEVHGCLLNLGFKLHTLNAQTAYIPIFYWRPNFPYLCQLISHHNYDGFDSLEVRWFRDKYRPMIVAEFVKVTRTGTVMGDLVEENFFTVLKSFSQEEQVQLLFYLDIFRNNK